MKPSTIIVAISTIHDPTILTHPCRPTLTDAILEILLKGSTIDS